MGVLSWLLSWIVLFALLYILSARNWGKTIIYYTTWLIIVLLIVLNGNEIASIFASGNITGNSSQSGGTSYKS
jgi:hypothetical protein